MLSKTKKYILTIVLVYITGCADVRLVQQQISQLKEKSPKCFSQIECNTMMEAAQIWLSNNSLLKIQMATTAIIQTYTDTKNHCIYVSYIVEKVPIRINEWKITLSSSCEGTDHVNKLNSFNNFISSTVDSKNSNVISVDNRENLSERNINSNKKVKDMDNIHDQLKIIKGLKDSGLITDKEYEIKRNKLVDKL